MKPPFLQERIGFQWLYEHGTEAHTAGFNAQAMRSDKYQAHDSARRTEDSHRRLVLGDATRRCKRSSSTVSKRCRICETGTDAGTVCVQNRASEFAAASLSVLESVHGKEDLASDQMPGSASFSTVEDTGEQEQAAEEEGLASYRRLRELDEHNSQRRDLATEVISAVAGNSQEVNLTVVPSSESFTRSPAMLRDKMSIAFVNQR
jgi:hypothetical protein